jgi:ABC-type iron transport system FetAB ATPase subunit
MLCASNIRRQVNDRVILTNINFKISPGEILFVRGPSGTGKTLLLRSIAFLDPLQVSCFTVYKHRRLNVDFRGEVTLEAAEPLSNRAVAP